MKRRLKRKMAPACQSPPSRVCFNAIPQLETATRKPGRTWKELFANKSCLGRQDDTSVSSGTVLETSSPAALVGGGHKTNAHHFSPSMKSCSLSSKTQHTGRGDVIQHHTSNNQKLK